MAVKQYVLMICLVRFLKHTKAKRQFEILLIT